MQPEYIMPLVSEACRKSVMQLHGKSIETNANLHYTQDKPVF